MVTGELIFIKAHVLLTMMLEKHFLMETCWSKDLLALECIYEENLKHSSYM